MIRHFCGVSCVIHNLTKAQSGFTQPKCRQRGTKPQRPVAQLGREAARSPSFYGTHHTPKLGVYLRNGEPSAGVGAGPKVRSKVTSTKPHFTGRKHKRNRWTIRAGGGSCSKATRSSRDSSDFWSAILVHLTFNP